MTPTLTYFDFDGSRGLECRLALHVAGVPFQDVRIGRAEWMALKPSVPFGALPVLTFGDKKLAQSNAILNYVGRSHGLHPDDPWTAAEHDALMQSVEDLRHKMPSTKDLPAEQQQAIREDFAQGWLSQWASSCSARIQGPFLQGDTLNVADLKLAVILRAIAANSYDHIPGSFLHAWPKLGALQAAVEADPRVKAYWATRN